MKCNECENVDICLERREVKTLQGCTSGIPSRRVKTNADRIRNMSDEELVEFIVGLSKHCLAGIGKCDCSAYKTCKNCNVKVKEWLQLEAE